MKNKLGKDVLLKFKQNGADFFGAKDKYEKTPYDYVKQLNDENYLDMAKNIFEMNEADERQFFHSKCYIFTDLETG